MAPVSVFPSPMKVFPDIWLKKIGLELPSFSIWKNNLRTTQIFKEPYMSICTSYWREILFVEARTRMLTYADPQTTSRQGSVISSLPSSAANDAASVVINFMAWFCRNAASTSPFSRIFFDISSPNSLYFAMHEINVLTVFNAISTPLIDGGIDFICWCEMWNKSPDANPYISETIFVLESNYFSRIGKDCSQKQQLLQNIIAWNILSGELIITWFNVPYCIAAYGSINLVQTPF